MLQPGVASGDDALQRRGVDEHRRATWRQSAESFDTGRTPAFRGLGADAALGRLSADRPLDSLVVSCTCGAASSSRARERVFRRVGPGRRSRARPHLQRRAVLARGADPGRLWRTGRTPPRIPIGASGRSAGEHGARRPRPGDRGHAWRRSSSRGDRVSRARLRRAHSAARRRGSRAVAGGGRAIWRTRRGIARRLHTVPHGRGADAWPAPT